MRWSPVVITAALLGGIFSLAIAKWPSATPDPAELADNGVLAISKQMNGTSIPSPSSFDETRIQPLGSQESAEPRFKHLDELPLTELKTEIQEFWQQCTKKQECEQWLAELAETVSLERYQLIAEYPGKLKELETLMGSELIAQDATLTDKVAMVQAQRQQIWGEQAELLFAKENAFYEQRQQLAELQEESKYQTDGERLEALEQLYTDQDDEIAPETKYEQALSLLSDGLEGEELSQLKNKLASRYLDEDKVRQIEVRETQVIEQSQQVQSYQQGLAQLERDLAAARNSEYTHLSEAEWQIYKDQQIFDYRQQFFAHSD